jgi:hypothetical protein
MIGFSAALRQARTYSLALALLARRRFAKACTGSSKNMTPNRDTIMSKLPGSNAQVGLMMAPNGGPRIDRQMLTAKADELDGTIRRLTAMRDNLRRAAACPAPSHMECPTFRRLLHVFGSGT